MIFHDYPIIDFVIYIFDLPHLLQSQVFWHIQILSGSSSSFLLLLLNSCIVLSWLVCFLLIFPLLYSNRIQQIQSLDNTKQRLATRRKTRNNLCPFSFPFCVLTIFSLFASSRCWSTLQTPFGISAIRVQRFAGSLMKFSSHIMNSVSARVPPSPLAEAGTSGTVRRVVLSIYFAMDFI